MDLETLHEQLSAYADGELNAAETRDVDALLQRSEEARVMLRRIQDASSAMRDLPRHAAPPSIADDVLAQVERQALLDETPMRGRRDARRTPSSLARWSMAAGLLLTVSAGLWAVSSLRRDYRARQERMAVAPRETETATANKAAPRSAAPSNGDSLFRDDARSSSSRPGDSTFERSSRPGQDVSLAARESPRAEAVSTTTSGDAPVVREARRQESRDRHEPACLRIEVADVRQRDLVARRVSERLRAARVPERRAELNGVDGAEHGNEAFFQEKQRALSTGNAMANESRSFLVRAEPDLVARLAEDAAGLEPPARVRLETDGARHDGIAATQSRLLAMSGGDGPSRTRRQLSFSDRPVPAADESASRAIAGSGGEGGATRDARTERESDGSLNSLWNAFGLDPEMFAQLIPKQETDRGAGTKPTTPRPPLRTAEDSSAESMGPPDPDHADDQAEESLVRRRLRDIDKAAFRAPVESDETKRFSPADSTSTPAEPVAEIQGASNDTKTAVASEAFPSTVDGSVVSVVIEIVPQSGSANDAPSGPPRTHRSPPAPPKRPPAGRDEHPNLGVR